MKKNGNMWIRENKLFLAVSAVLVLFIAACITLTVDGNEKNGAGGYDERYFDTLEAAYQEEISDVLEEYGVSRSGINLTKITSGDGTREYALTVYNQRFGHMDDDRRNSLKQALYSIPFPDAECSVAISLKNL